MLNKMVKAIGDINLTGNTIPHTWFGHKLLRRDVEEPVSIDNKCNINAILILSDIVYWYRPIITRDESTGFILEMRPKFSGSKLQKTYKLWAIQFGLSVRQVKEACYFLRDRGLITMECKNITLPDGSMLPNVTFFEPIAEAIKVISDINTATKVKYNTEIKEPEEGYTLQSIPSYIEKGGGIHSNVRGYTLECNSTESTSEISTDIPSLAEFPQERTNEAIIKVPIFPKIEVDSLKSKEDVHNAFGTLIEYAVYAEQLRTLVTAKSISDFKLSCAKTKHIRKNCTLCKPATKNCKIHLKPCECLTPQEIPAYKILLEAINILTGGSADFSKESLEMSKFIRKLHVLKYPVQNIIGCIAYSYTKGKYDIFPMTISNIHKLMPEFLNKVRTGELKESLALGNKLYESTSDKNWKTLQKNKEEIITNAAKASEEFNARHGITARPRI